MSQVLTAQAVKLLEMVTEYQLKHHVSVFNFCKLFWSCAHLSFIYFTLLTHHAPELKI